MELRHGHVRPAFVILLLPVSVPGLLLLPTVQA